MGRKNWSGSQAPAEPVTAGPTIGNLSFAQLVKLLGSSFLPASLGTAPLAEGSAGGRTAVLTTKSSLVQSVNGKTGAVTIVSPPIEVLVAALVGGTYTWTFASAFNSPPVVFAIGIGSALIGTHANPSVLYTGTPTANACVISATDATDARQIMLIAVGNPS